MFRRLAAQSRAASVVVLFASVSPVIASETVADAIVKLGADQPKEARIAAATALQRKKLEKNEREVAIPVLCTWLKDKDVEFRKTAVISLACIMIGTKGKCPLEIVQAMFDDSPDVRLHAGICVSECREFSREAITLLFRAIESEDKDVRNVIPMLLADVAKDDGRTLPALKKAATDKDPFVQGNSITALFKMTHDFDLVVPYYLRKIEDYRDLLDTIKKEDLDRELEKRQFAPTIFYMSSQKFLVEYGETEPDKLGRSLIKLLSDKSPAIRYSAVQALGEIAERNEDSRRALLRIDAHIAVEKLTDDDARGRPIAGAALNALDRLRGLKP